MVPLHIAAQAFEGIQSHRTATHNTQSVGIHIHPLFTPMVLLVGSDVGTWPRTTKNMDVRGTKGRKNKKFRIFEYNLYVFFAVILRDYTNTKFTRMFHLAELQAPKEPDIAALNPTMDNVHGMSAYELRQWLVRENMFDEKSFSV